MSQFKSLFLVPLLLSTATGAWAEEAPAPAPDAAAVGTASDAIVVTATRLALTPDQVPASVTVLDKQAIDRAQDIGVTELLSRTPGISITRNGGYGTATSVRIRGAEADQTVVVIDGVKLNDPSSTGGGYNFGNLLIGDTTRIEVLRGPQSILWGSQAIGGVVNIVTPLPENALEGSFDVEAGSRETVSARAALGGRTGPLAWRIGGQLFTTDGISAFADGTEPDGYTNRSASGRAVLDLAPGVSVDVRGFYNRGRTDIDGFNVDSPEYAVTEEWVGYAGLNFDLLDGRFRNRVAYTRTETDRDNYNPTRARQQTFDAAGVNRRFEYQGSFAVADGWTIVAGAENERSNFRSVSPPASLATPIPAPVRGEAEITSFYGQLNAEPVAGLTLNAGLRHDDHDRYGGKTLFAAGGVWRLDTGTVLRASYGEGFKAPTLYQLFSEFGNAALAPEVAKGWEAGAEQRLLDGKLTFGATYFERTTKSQIIFASCIAPTTDPLCVVPGTTTSRFGYYLNVATAKAHGIEAKAALELGGFSLDGNYSWIVADDRSVGTANFGKWLPRRPRHQANGSISYEFPFGLTTGAAVRWSGKAYDNAANTTVLRSYTLVDLRAEYRLGEGVELFARAENLFDEKYQTAFRFGTLGRSVFAGLRGRF